MALSIDGSVIQAAGAFGGSNSTTITLSTTKTNSLIVVAIASEKTATTHQTVSTVTATGLTFTKRASVYQDNITGAFGTTWNTLEIWSAPATAVQTSKVITVTMTGGGTVDCGICAAFGVNFDTVTLPVWTSNVAMPRSTTSAATSAPTHTGGATNANAMFLAFANSADTVNQTIGSGFTLIKSGNNPNGSIAMALGAEFKLLTGAQSGQTAAFGSSYHTWGIILDAIEEPSSGPTGTLAVTETPDVAAFTGDVLVSGTLATTEAADIAAFTGSVVVSGSLSVTEGTDTASFSGFVGVSGSLATTESQDIPAFSGSVVVSGSLAVTEGQDTAAFTGSVVVSGALAVTENADIASFSGDVVVSGSLVTTETTDIAAFTGTTGNVVSGTLSATDSQDVASFSGSVVVSGSLSTTEDPDTANFSGSVVVSGTLSVTDGQDIASFSGSVVSEITGTLATTEAQDIAHFEEMVIVGGIWHQRNQGKPKYHVSRTENVLKAALHMSSLGGQARAQVLTAKQRTVIASTAAQARWSKR